MSSLVAAEMALSVALLVGAGLLIESVVRLSTEPLGFEPDHVITTKVGLPEESYPEAKRVQFYDELQRRLVAQPGVEGVALSFNRGRFDPIEIGGRPQSSPHLIAWKAVNADYLSVLKIQLLRGRAFDERDGPGAENVAIVNQAFVREFLAGSDPIGRQIRLGDTGKQGPWLTIVGVAGNVKGQSLYREMNLIESSTVFRALRQDSERQIAVEIRVAADAGSIGEMLQREIAVMDPAIPVGEVQTLNARLSKDLAYPRFRAFIFGAFAIAALLLAAVGLYGVLGQLVEQRRHEFAVRMAVGASRGNVFLLVTRHAGLLVTAGLLIGLAYAVALTRGLTSLLYGVKPTEPATLAAMSAVLRLVAAIAMAVPAHRATKVDPMAALRDE